MKNLKIGTFHLKDNKAKPTSSMYWVCRLIDHILISPDFLVESVCKNGQIYYGIQPSDHCAVFAKLKKKTNR